MCCTPDSIIPSLSFWDKNDYFNAKLIFGCQKDFGYVISTGYILNTLNSHSSTDCARGILQMWISVN